MERLCHADAYQVFSQLRLKVAYAGLNPTETLD